MPDFLETIETIRAEEASVQKLFNSRGDGEGVRSGRRRHRMSEGEYKVKLARAAKLLAELYTGKRPFYHFAEAMSSSDFPLLFGDIIDRQLLANYREAPYSWDKVAKKTTVRDFRTVNRFKIDGGEADLEAVPQGAAYPAASLSEGRYQYSVSKYGRTMPFLWEQMINDDLDAFRDIPERFGKAARRTEEKFVTDLFFNAAGPDSTFFAAGNSNIVTSNPVLSIAGLQTGMEVLAAQTDEDGEPITIEAVTLWVPPALDITAHNIVNALQLELTESGGTSNQKLIATNWMKSRVTVAVGYYIPLVASSLATDPWVLVADPNNGRPAAEVGKLRGHEEPEVFIKAPNAQRVGGGADAMDGDFDTDGIEYKVRHVIGGTLMDPKMAVASDGSGS